MFSRDPDPPVQSFTAWDKIQRLLSYAYSKVPYYRRLFHDIGLHPQEVDSFQKFSQIPCLPKHVVQQQWNEFISEDYQPKDLLFNHTSGSTGTPLKLAWTRGERAIAGRHFMRERMRWGLTLPTRWAMVGDTLDFVAGNTNPIRVKQRGTEDMLMLHWDLTPSSLHRYIKELEAFQPSWIYSYPPMLGRVAQFILSNGISVDLPHLKLIELGGEYLLPQTREDITQAFHHKPASQYACRELWCIAFECSQGGMHVVTENVVLEILKNDGTPAAPGESGEAIVTGLHNYSMPFIRYKLGDVVMPVGTPCTCGDPRPLIAVPGGRIANFMFGRHNKVGDLTFNLIVRHLYDVGYQGIQEFRVIQRSETHFDVWIVRTSSWEPIIQELFTQKAQNLLGADIHLEYTFMDSIPLTSAGKSRPFVIDLW